MRERIKMLIAQATNIEEYGWGASYENFDKEKFAELLVRECATVVDNAPQSVVRFAPYLLEHFEVEEC